MMKINKQSGFTLIEMIVSLAVFAVVITIAVGALLVLVGTSERLQEEQNIMSNLAFALDSVTREIRTGTNYHCDSRDDYTDAAFSNMFRDDFDLEGLTPTTTDCFGRAAADNELHGMAFTESGDSITGAAASRILYFHDSSTGQLLRRVGSGSAAPITSSNIYIHDVDFFVTGSLPQSEGVGEDDQASVTIFVAASATSSTPSTDWYQVQTTISQRTLDI